MEKMGEENEMSRLLILALAAALVILTGCATFYGLVETDAALMGEQKVLD